MKKKILYLSMLVLAGVLACSCSSKKGEVSPPTVPKPAAAPPPPSDSVLISSSGFSKDVVTVKAGQSVLWINTDTHLHTVTEKVTSGTPSFFSPDLAKGDRYVFTFKTAGVYYYFCAFHRDQPLGSVSVEN